MKTNKLTSQEKKAIREAAAMIYAASELEEIYNKDQFLNELKAMICNTPVASGYAESMRTLDNFK